MAIQIKNDNVLIGHINGLDTRVTAIENKFVSNDFIGNSYTASYPLGFSYKTADATWGNGNKIGDFITGWSGPSNSDIAFRNNGGQLNMVIDGFLYQREGNARVLDTSDVTYQTFSVSITKTGSGNHTSGAFTLPAGMWFLMGSLSFNASSTTNKIQLKFNNLTFCPWNNDSEGGDTSKECMCFGFHNSSSATSVTCNCWSDFTPTSTTATISIVAIKLRA